MRPLCPNPCSGSNLPQTTARPLNSPRTRHIQPCHSLYPSHSLAFPLGSLRAITLPSGFPTAYKPDVVLSQSLFTCCFLSLESSIPRHLKPASLLCSKSSLKGLPSLTVPFKPAPPGMPSPHPCLISLSSACPSNIPSNPFIQFACLSLHVKCMLQKSMDFFFNFCFNTL